MNLKIAVIPARGGSKRIPRKNIKCFEQLPIIAYSIRAALETKLFDKVIVSTDDDEIAEVARFHGAIVPFKRPPELSDDNATTAPVIEHAINWFVSQGHNVELACCIYPCAPFLNGQILLNAYQLFVHKKYDFLFPVVAFHSSPFRSLKRLHDGSMQFNFPEHELTRTQDLPTCYFDAGMFYLGKASAWLSDSKVKSKSFGYLIDSTIVVDIDTEEDWLRAERLAQLRKFS